MPEATPRDNHILDALPAEERDRLFRHLSFVSMPLGRVLYESGETLKHIYFPTDSIVSLLYVMKNGASAEIAVVGNEGARPASSATGEARSPSSTERSSSSFRANAIRSSRRKRIAS